MKKIFTLMTFSTLLSHNNQLGEISIQKIQFNNISHSISNFLFTDETHIAGGLNFYNINIRDPLHLPTLILPYRSIFVSQKERQTPATNWQELNNNLLPLNPYFFISSNLISQDWFLYFKCEFLKTYSNNILSYKNNSTKLIKEASISEIILLMPEIGIQYRLTNIILISFGLNAHILSSYRSLYANKITDIQLTEHNPFNNSNIINNTNWTRWLAQFFSINIQLDLFRINLYYSFSININISLYNALNNIKINITKEEEKITIDNNNTKLQPILSLSPQITYKRVHNIIQ